MTWRNVSLQLTFAIIVSAVALIATPTSVAAVSASDWKAGYIIDDSLFYDNSSMSVDAIQGFLNSRVVSCDINGTQSAADLGYPNMTHAQYAATQGWPGPPYVCLKDYYQVPDSTQVVSNFQGSIPTGALSAAQIIKNAADTYHVSPKAILATLQKESLNLIYDNWPMLSQYKNAMGYGCPDTAPCDAKYEGFYNQISNAAYQFNLYRAYPNNYRYKPFQTNSIYYNPNTSCGASDVNIQNFATAGLYNYTPYQPNQAALNNLYGSGDACSAYGNRNFWRIFNDWFGSGVFIENNQLYVTSPMNISNTPVVKGEPITLSYTVQNKSASSMDTGVLWICTSLNGYNYGSGSIRRSLASQETVVVSMQYTPQSVGTLTAGACGDTPHGTGFTEGYPNEIQYGYRDISANVHPTGITVTSGIKAVSPLFKGVPNTLTYTVQNRGQTTEDTGDLWVCTALGGKSFGGGGVRKTLAVNESLTVSMPYIPSTPGILDITACGNPPGGSGWMSGYPIRNLNSDGNQQYAVAENPIVITSAIATTTQPMAGVPTTVSYQVQNKASVPVDTGILWVCSALNNKPYGSGATSKTLAPNETLTVSMPYTPTETGKLELVACGNYPGGPGWVSGYPVRQYYDHGYRTYGVTKNPIVISTAIYASSAPLKGVPTTLAYQVQNRSTQSVDIGTLWICTALNGVPLGGGALSSKTLAPNETLTVSMPYTPTETGKLELVACGNYPGGPGWVSWYPSRDYFDHGYRTYSVTN